MYDRSYTFWNPAEKKYISLWSEFNPSAAVYEVSHILYEIKQQYNNLAIFEK